VKTRVSDWLKKRIPLPPPKRTPASPLVRTLRRLFLLFTLLVLGSFTLWRALLAKEISSRFARIRAAGFPTSGAELNAWRATVPDAENGALVLTQAFALAQASTGRFKGMDDPDLLNRTNTWPAVTRALVEDYVQTNAPALAKAREALMLPKFRYSVDFAYGPDAQMPHLSHLKEIARIAALKAALDAENGLSDRWPEEVDLQLRLATTLDDEPTLISHLVRLAMIRLAVRTTERSLNRVTPNVQLCQKLQAAFTRAGETNLLPLALVGERAMCIPVFRLSWAEIQSVSKDGELEGQPRKPQRYSGKPMPFLWFTGFFERDLDLFLQTMEKSVSLAALPFPASLTLTNYLEAASRAAQKNACILSGMLLPSLSRIVVREAATEAAIRLAATALTVERFRADRGRLPDNLSELTPQFLDALPPDPFDGAPLRYRRLTNGYVIYSIDADGHDDGGREPPAPKKSTDTNSYDITFLVEQPAL